MWGEGYVLYDALIHCLKGQKQHDRDCDIMKFIMFVNLYKFVEEAEWQELKQRRI